MHMSCYSISLDFASPSLAARTECSAIAISQCVCRDISRGWRPAAVLGAHASSREGVSGLTVLTRECDTRLDNCAVDTRVETARSQKQPGLHIASRQGSKGGVRKSQKKKTRSANVPSLSFWLGPAVQCLQCANKKVQKNIDTYAI